MKTVKFRRLINRVINYIFVVQTFIVRAIISWYTRKPKQYSLYKNKEDILKFNELISSLNFIETNRDIKRIDFIQMATFKSSTMRMLEDVCNYESYYRLNWLDFYLETGYDKDWNMDFIGDVASVFVIQTTAELNYMVVINQPFSKREYKEEIVLQKEIKHFKIEMITLPIGKVCDELPPPSVFD